MSNPIRILHIVPNMQAGGLETFIMNIYRNIDRTKIQFDFLVHYQDTFFYDNEILKLGGKIYRFSLRDDHRLIKYLHQLDKFYKQHPEYKIIHCHMSSIGAINFAIAKKNGVHVRIAHSHNSNTERTLKGAAKSLLIKPLKFMSTYNLACSNQAGIFLYGHKKPFKVVPNAIDINKFKNDEKRRLLYRKNMKLQNALVIGHIGRFDTQKNHKFLIDIFAQVHKKAPNTVLLLAGEGNLKKHIQQYVAQQQLSESVLFLGEITNTPDFYCGIDIFVLPSLFEGLPVVGIEAQIAGKKCIFSDAITKDVQISSNVNFLPIGTKATQQWADEIITSNNTTPSSLFPAAQQYNIDTISQWLTTFYRAQLKENY